MSDMHLLSYFNPRSMAVTLALGTVMVAAVLHLTGSALKWRLPGQRLAASGVLLLTLGVLGLTLSGLIDAWALAAAQSAMVTGLGCTVLGLERMRGRPASWWTVGLLCVLGCVVAVGLGVWQPSTRWRVGGLALIQGLAAAWLALLCWSEPRPAWRSGLRLIALGATSAALLLLARGVMVGVLGLMPTPFGQPTWLNAVLTLVGGLSFLAMVVGQVLVASGDLIEVIRQESLHDPLTELSNRRGLRDWLVRLPGNASVAVALLDLDHFKNINDQWGHDVGDQVLCRLGRHLRTLQTDHRLAVRLGGEEFALVQWAEPDAASAQDHASLLHSLTQVVENLRAQLEHMPEVPVFSFSAGVAVGHTGVFEVVLQTADRRMYAAKAAGRNRVVFADAQ